MYRMGYQNYKYKYCKKKYFESVFEVIGVIGVFCELDEPENNLDAISYHNKNKYNMTVENSPLDYN